MIMMAMSKWLLLYMIALMALATFMGPGPLVAQSSPDSRFGMTEVFWMPEEAQDLGVGWERILFYWREIQPTGPEDWNTLHVREEWLAQANAQGRTVVGLIKNTAPWASTDGTEAGLPKGLYLPIDDPGNLWASYVRKLGEYYGERNVHHWIIWNEPEIEPGVYGFEFAGSVTDYYQLLKTAYKVLRKVDPQAVIHLAGLTWWHDPTFLDRLLAIASEDPESREHDHFFDVISLHIYFRTETVKTIIDQVTAIQERYGLAKPVWINETNAPPNRDPYWPVERPVFNVNLDQQAWFIIQAMALGFASGADSVSVYKLVDIRLPPGGESFGVVRPDNSRRPAYDAYKLATNCFSNFSDVTISEQAGYYHVIFSRPGSLTHVAWSRTPVEASVQIAARTESATLVTLSQNGAVQSEAGFYSLRLPGQICDRECIIGGEPLLLVENLSDQYHSNSCTGLALNASDLARGTSQEASASVRPEGRGMTTTQVVSSTVSATSTTTPESPRPGVTADKNREMNHEQLAETQIRSHTEASTEMTGTMQVEGSEINATSGGGTTQREIGEAGEQTAGLWFLGAGAIVALSMAFLVIRHKND